MTVTSCVPFYIFRHVCCLNWAERWQCCHGLLVQCRALPLCGPRGSNQIIWSDPVEWNGVREGQPVALCFSLRSNVIRAQWERHGLDCNPPESLLPPRSDLFASPLSPSPTHLVPRLRPKLNQSRSFSLSTSPRYWDSATPFFNPALLLICPLDLLTLSVSLWLGIRIFWSVPMFWSLSTTVFLTFSLNYSDWKSPHVNLAIWGVISPILVLFCFIGRKCSIRLEQTLCTLGVTSWTSVATM